MIKISKIEDDDNVKFDFVKCPSCGKGRLCDKSKGARVHIIQIHGNGLDHVIIKCPKCGSRYLISADDQ
jgi:DNA-directed RNA polymerase subunit RPC12/RpoP